MIPTTSDVLTDTDDVDSTELHHVRQHRIKLLFYKTNYNSAKII